MTFQNVLENSHNIVVNLVYLEKRGKPHYTGKKHKSFPVVFKSAFGQIVPAVNFTMALRCFSLPLAPS